MQLAAAAYYIFHALHRYGSTANLERCFMNATPVTVYLSVEQVAARYNVSKDAIWRWRREGDFPKPVKLGLRPSRWRLSDLEAYESQCPTCFVTSVSFPITL